LSKNAYARVEASGAGLAVRRRAFLTMALGGTAIWPTALFGQKPALARIGYLAAGTPEKAREIVAGVLAGLAEAGYVESQNLEIEFRWAEFQMDRIPALFADLVQRRPAAIITFPQPPVSEVKEASNSIPIIGFFGADPVSTGLVSSLNRPGGNITGVSVLNYALLSKRLEMLRELVPTNKLVGYLGNPSTAGLMETELSGLQTAAQTLGVHLLVLQASNSNEFEPMFSTLVQKGAGALFVGQDALFQRNSDRLAALAIQYRTPAMFANRNSTVAGGLISYGTSYREAYRLIGLYTGRILKGEKAADLPVQQVTKIELVINLKTAKALGIEVPPALLARADEVIE
jgi:putative tryptophan/tyrosine transport system substrate-binding protein